MEIHIYSGLSRTFSMSQANISVPLWTLEAIFLILNFLSVSIFFLGPLRSQDSTQIVLPRSNKHFERSCNFWDFRGCSSETGVETKNKIIRSCIFIGALFAPKPNHGSVLVLVILGMEILIKSTSKLIYNSLQ